MHTKLRHALAASVESHDVPDAVTTIDHQISELGYTFTRNLDETPAPQEIAAEINQVENTVVAIDMIADKLTDPEDTVAIESASFAWSVLCKSEGIDPTSVSVESRGMSDTRDSLLQSSTESISKDALKLAKRFETSGKVLADARGLLTKIKREVDVAVPLIDKNGVSMNMAGIYSFLSRDFTPVGDVLNALEEEEGHIKDMTDALDDLCDYIKKAAADMGKLDPAKDGLTGCLRIIDAIPYDKVYSKLLSKQLLNSGSFIVENYDEFDVPLLGAIYHHNSDGSGLTAKSWVKVGAAGAIGGLLTLAIGSANTALGVAVGAAAGLTVGAIYKNAKWDNQGANTNFVASGKDLSKIMDVAIRILNKATDARRQMNEIKIATSTMQRIATTHAKWAKDNDQSWQSVADTGLKLAATVGMAIASKGRSNANYMDDAKPSILEEIEAKIYWCNTSHECMVDVVQTHVGIVGTGVLKLGSAILHAVGRDKV